MLRPGHGVALLTLALLIFGVVMVNSAGLLVGASVPNVTYDSVFLGAPMQHAMLAVAAMALGTMIPLRRFEAARGWRSPAPWLLLGSVLLLLLVWAPIGITMNASSRWLEVGGVRFQASEFAKWTLPLFLAWFLTRPSIEVERPIRGLLPSILVIGLVTGLIAIEDFGTAFLVGCVSLVLLLGAGARLWHLLTLAPLALVALVVGIIAEPYRVTRLMTYLDPWADPEGDGWHIIESMRAISGGGVMGRGLGAGEQKFDLTSDTTDFIFSIICEELGMVGAALVIAAFIGLMLCGLAIICDRREGGDAREHRSEPFVRLLGLGVILTIGMQAFFNILVTTALVPTKGIALPLISRGGTGWILTAFCLGLVIAIERGRNRAKTCSTEPIPSDSSAPAPVLPTGEPVEAMSP
jgi:cell division protein FtsW